MNVTYTCSACGLTQPGLPSEDYRFPEPPAGWIWFFGNNVEGPHACSKPCWDAVKIAPSGKLYLSDSHEDRTRQREDIQRTIAEQKREPIPPPRPKIIESSSVYFIQRGTDGPVKIGHSKRVSARLAGLQSGCPEPLSLIGILPGGRKKEMELHAKYADLRLTGEWFKPAVLEELKAVA